MIYVRFRGKSYELAERVIGADARSTDDEIRCNLARHLDVSVEELDDYVIERPRHGGLIVRPIAVYG